jgi:hypothetical protein
LAANPIPEVPTIKVIGGPLFATPDNRGFYDTDRNNFQPRIGAAYQINEKTVLRGGFAIYMVPFIFDTQISLNAIQQPGFSQATNLMPRTTMAAFVPPWLIPIRREFFPRQARARAY